MLPFKLIYSDKFYLPIGAHVFPAQKYRLIHQRLLESKIATAGDFPRRRRMRTSCWCTRPSTSAS